MRVQVMEVMGGACVPI